MEIVVELLHAYCASLDSAGASKFKALPLSAKSLEQLKECFSKPDVRVKIGRPVLNEQDGYLLQIDGFTFIVKEKKQTPDKTTGG